MVVPVGKTSVLAVIDTGAQVTVDSDRVLPTGPHCNESVLLRGIDHGVTAKLVKGLEIQLGRGNYKWEVYVAPIKYDMIIGLDFMTANQMCIIITRNLVFIAGEVVPAVFKQGLNKSYNISSVVATRGVVVPPNAYMNITGSVNTVAIKGPSQMGSNFLLFPDFEAPLRR